MQCRSSVTLCSANGPTSASELTAASLPHELSQRHAVLGTDRKCVSLLPFVCVSFAVEPRLLSLYRVTRGFSSILSSGNTTRTARLCFRMAAFGRTAAVSYLDLPAVRDTH